MSAERLTGLARHSGAVYYAANHHKFAKLFAAVCAAWHADIGPGTRYGSRRGLHGTVLS